MYVLAHFIIFTTQISQKIKKNQTFPLKSGRTRKIPLNFDRSQIIPKLTFSGKPLNLKKKKKKKKKKKNLLNFERFLHPLRQAQKKCAPPSG